jgi:hypothetical protein
MPYVRIMEQGKSNLEDSILNNAGDGSRLALKASPEF